MKKIRFVLIGAGYIANYHARALLELEHAEISTVCGLEEELIQQFAKKYSISETTTNAFDLIYRNDVDAVVISTPNKFHAPLAIEFLKNGKDVFIEKPMAMSVREGEEITRIAHTTKRLVCVGHMWRFDTEVNYIKNVVESGKIGKIFKTKGYGIHQNWGPTGWFTQKKLAGGGALADMGVHAIDTVRYVLGNPHPLEVYAKIDTYFGNYDVDDSGVVLITWSNGTVSIIESGWMHPHSDGPEAATQLFGTKGYASVFPTKIKTNRGDYPGEYLPLFSERSEHCDQIIYTRQMAHFIDAIKKRIEPNPGLMEGLTVLKIVEAAYKSAKKGKVVRIV